jgi:threonine aldolase
MPKADNHVKNIHYLTLFNSFFKLFIIYLINYHNLKNLILVIMKIVDFRSDTVTKPSPEMWEAVKSMDNSKLGDDVLGEDPSVNELENKAAKIIGKEAALLVTSGTQGNLVSLLSQTNPGDEILLEEQSHIFGHEVGSAARIGGLMIRTYSSNKGVPSIKQLQDLIRKKDDIHEPATALISAEDTHNFHGGAIVKPEILRDLKDFARKNGLNFHLDGARIFNAAVGSNLPVTEFTKHVDSVMFCLSKGLSCPVGSIVAGSKGFISKARKFRKMIGGGMRQAGIIAAFGLVALEAKWIQRLEEDHKNAKILAEGLESFDFPIKIDTPDTNIVIMEFLNKVRIFKIITELGKEGILAFNISKDKIRFVTHYGIQENDIQFSINTLGKVLQRFI